MKISGIYKIQSLIKPTRCYIGSAINISQRWGIHLNLLRKNKHHSKKLQRYYDKYGESDLIFIILELCFPEFLTAREQYYINKLKPWFNICKIAGSPLGNRHSIETKQKMREIKMGKSFSEEHKQNMKIAWGERKLIPVSEETKKRLSISHKGIRPTKEQCIAMSEFRKGKPRPEGVMEKLYAFNRGKKRSEETKRKISESQIGKKLSEKTKRKIGEKTKGNQYAKGNQNMKGKHHTNETKMKLSIAARKQWENKRIV